MQNKDKDGLQNKSDPVKQTSPSEQKDVLSRNQQTQVSNVDLNDNYNNKFSSTSTKPEFGQSQTQAPSSPLSPVIECPGIPRIERKLSIEIKKVPLQEGPRSFDTSSSVGGAGGQGASSCSSGCMLQRGQAFKSRSTQSLLTSSSSLSEDSGTEGGALGCLESHTEGSALPRPNHLPVKSGDKVEPRECSRVDVKTGHASWTEPCNSPEKLFPKTSSSSSSSDRVAPSSSSSSHLSSSSSSSSSSTPVRTAISFTNPLHSDNSEEDGNEVMSCEKEALHTSVSMVTTVVSSSLLQPVRKALPVSIVGHSISSPTAATASMSKCHFQGKLKRLLPVIFRANVFYFN